MTFRTCSYEKELTQALKDGHWPQGCGAELCSHVDACGNCSDLVLVPQTFQRARGESERVAACGSPSLLWWRAQLRRPDRPLRVEDALRIDIPSLVRLVRVPAGRGVR